MITPIVVILWLMFGIASGMIGQSKGLPFGYYFLWGLLFGPIGLIVSLCVRPDKRPAPRQVGPVTGVPGWYEDPLDRRFVRYWDGVAWTQQLRQVYS